MTLLATAVSGQNYLSVNGGSLYLHGEKVFMSGMNLAWQDFGNDFGNGQYDCCTGSTLEDYLTRISVAGGNSISKSIVHLSQVMSDVTQHVSQSCYWDVYYSTFKLVGEAAWGKDHHQY